MQRILTTIILASMAVSCKTKNKSASIIQPKTLTGGDDTCSLNIAQIPELPPVPASALKINKIELSTDFSSKEEKVEFTVNENTSPDVIIYEGFKRDGNTKFAGAAFGKYSINPTIPDGALSITAWACVEPTRKTGGNYLQKAYAGQKFLCGAAKERTLSNKNKSTSQVGLTLASIERDIEETCMAAYRRITDKENYKKALASKNVALISSIRGLLSMKIGAFTAKCVAEGADLASTTEYASGLNLSVSNDGCLPDIDDDAVDDYVSTTPPPVSDPTEFILPPPTDEPAPGTTGEQTSTGEETPKEDTKVEETVSAATTEDEAKAACKYDNERREEMGVGGAEWDPQQGICFYFNNEKEVVNSIEPSIPKSEVPLEEIVSEPAPQSSDELSKGKKWGLAFFAIGGIFASGLARYKYLKSGSQGLSGSDTLKEVNSIFDETDLKSQQDLYRNTLARTDIKLSNNDKELLNALSREIDDRLKAVTLTEALENLENELEDLKKTGEETPERKRKALELESQIDIARSQRDLALIRSQFSLANEAEFSSLKKDAIDRFNAAKKKFSELSGISDDDISDIQIKTALEGTDPQLRATAYELSSFKEITAAIDDAEVIKSHPSGLSNINRKLNTKLPTTTKRFNFQNVKNYVFSDWKGKGVAAGVVAAIIGTGALIFGLAFETTVDLGENEGKRLSGLHYCKNQLIKRGALSKGCQKLVSQ